MNETNKNQKKNSKKLIFLGILFIILGIVIGISTYFMKIFNGVNRGATTACIVLGAFILYFSKKTLNS